MFLLGDDNQYHFHNSSGTSSANIWASYASSNVINGNRSPLNGTRNINGQTTPTILAFHPSPFYLLKLRVMLRLADLVETVPFGGRNF